MGGNVRKPKLGNGTRIGTTQPPNNEQKVLTLYECLCCGHLEIVKESDPIKDGRQCGACGKHTTPIGRVDKDLSSKCNSKIIECYDAQGNLKKRLVKPIT